MTVTRRRSLADLHALSEVERKMGKFQQVHKMLLKEIASWKTENGCLSEYVSEFNLLTQEKLAHVEVLRQINCDMNQLELIIKQARNDQMKTAETARRLFSELMPLKDEINYYRVTVNQELLPDGVISKEAMNAILLAEQQAACTTNVWQQPMGRADLTPSAAMAATSIGVSTDFTAMVSSASSLANTATSSPASVAAAHSSAYRVNSQFDLLGHLSLPTAAATSNYQCLFSPVVDLSISNVVPKQQQPPPMKTCNSCQQQIHRNAPICPLCKSKSRSRNPKKAKVRKVTE